MGKEVSNHGNGNVEHKGPSHHGYGKVGTNYSRRKINPSANENPTQINKICVIC